MCCTVPAFMCASSLDAGILAALNTPSGNSKLQPALAASLRHAHLGMLECSCLHNHVPTPLPALLLQPTCARRWKECLSSCSSNIACSLPYSLQETNQEVPEFLSQAAAMAGPYVPPVRLGGGGSTFGGSFGKSFSGGGTCFSILRLYCQDPLTWDRQRNCL